MMPGLEGMSSDERRSMRRLRSLGSKADRTVLLYRTCFSLSGMTLKVRLCPTCSAMPTKTPFRSGESEGNAESSSLKYTGSIHWKHRRGDISGVIPVAMAIGTSLLREEVEVWLKMKHT